MVARPLRAWQPRGFNVRYCLDSRVLRRFQGAFGCTDSEYSRAQLGAGDSMFSAGRYISHSMLARYGMRRRRGPQPTRTAAPAAKRFRDILLATCKVGGSLCFLTVDKRCFNDTKVFAVKW